MAVACTQCGASFEPPAGERLLRCAYCDTALVVDGSATLYHEMMVPTIGLDQVPAHLRRFLGGTATVADLDKKADLGQPVLEYFPFWAFRIATASGDRVVLEPAAPSSLQGIQGMTLPPGESREWTDEVAGETPIVEPEVPLSTARQWMETRLGEVQIRRTVLYHLPMFRFSYSYQGKSYRAAVDGVSGQVFPADFPAKAEAPFFADDRTYCS